MHFQNLNDASFWHSGTDVCIITDAVTTKLKANVLVTPPLYTYLIKNERSLNWSNFNVVYLFIYSFIYLFIYLFIIYLTIEVEK